MGNENERLEALELRLMRAWVGDERKVMRQLLSRRFRLVLGAPSPVLLDRKSLLDAAVDRWQVAAFRLGSVYSREAEGVGIFAAQVELDCRIDGKDVSGRWWMSDLWRKSAMTRRWQLLDRQLARPDASSDFPLAVKALQLWR